MKEVEDVKKMGKILATIGKESAKAACNSASVWLMHQPKEPECLKKTKKSIDK